MNIYHACNICIEYFWKDTQEVVKVLIFKEGEKGLERGGRLVHIIKILFGAVELWALFL